MSRWPKGRLTGNGDFAYTDSNDFRGGCDGGTPTNGPTPSTSTTQHHKQRFFLDNMILITTNNRKVSNDIDFH